MPTPNVTALCAMEEGAPEVLRNIREDYRARCEESDIPMGLSLILTAWWCPKPGTPGDFSPASEIRQIR